MLGELAPPLPDFVATLAPAGACRAARLQTPGKSIFPLSEHAETRWEFLARKNGLAGRNNGFAETREPLLGTLREEFGCRFVKLAHVPTLLGGGAPLADTGCTRLGDVTPLTDTGCGRLGDVTPRLHADRAAVGLASLLPA